MRRSERAARLAGRVSGDSTVAYAIAFAQAMEAALEIKVPRRAIWLRALMAELERLANHFGDIGAICNDASFSLMHAHCGALRERVLRASEACFGHRLMMDRVVPGGIAVDLEFDGNCCHPQIDRYGAPKLSRADRALRRDGVPAGSHRWHGFLHSALARQYGAGGYIGRASGRSFDARRTPGYAPYDELKFEIPVRKEGDVDARIWIRIREVEQSLALIEQITKQAARGLDPQRAGPCWQRKRKLRRAIAGGGIPRRHPCLGAR